MCIPQKRLLNIMEQRFTAKTDVGAPTILQGREIAKPRKTFGAQNLGALR